MEWMKGEMGWGGNRERSESTEWEELKDDMKEGIEGGCRGVWRGREGRKEMITEKGV